ncbi:MAG: isoamylase early set domain-containing protein [Caldilineaceae bacterium]
MFTKMPSTTPGYTHVVFTLPASTWAVHLSLVGDFNQWDQQRMAFTQLRSGEWRAEIELPVGQRYAFCYWLDGRCISEFHADGFVMSITGVANSIIDTSLCN